MSMRNSNTIRLILLLFLFLTGSCFAEDEDFTVELPEKTIKVGCLFPLTGPGGRYGRDSVAAIQLAQQYLQSINKNKNLEFDIRIGDTRSKSLRAVQIARSFVEKDKVDFLCGIVSSSVALAVTEVSRKQKVILIGTDHASPRLITHALHPYYFRVSNGTRQSMKAGAQYIRQNFSSSHPLKIAFIGPDYDYGYQAWDDLQGFLKEEKVPVEVVAEYWPKLFETDYSPYVHALIDSQPDIIINGHWGQDLVTFVKQANGLNLFDETVFMNFDAGGNYEIFEELGDDMPLGLVLSARHHVNWPPTHENRKFVEKFREQVGRYPSYAAEGAYAGILAIAEAVRISGGVNDRQRLRIALENLQIKLPEDPDGFISYMDPLTHQLLQVQAIGKTMPNNRYPPANVLLGDWSTYYPPQRWPVEIGNAP